MSDAQTCEGCGKKGRRPRGWFCPETWLYLEARDDEDPNPDNAIVLAACSAECAMKVWKPAAPYEPAPVLHHGTPPETKA